MIRNDGDHGSMSVVFIMSVVVYVVVCVGDRVNTYCSWDIR